MDQQCGEMNAVPGRSRFCRRQRDQAAAMQFPDLIGYDMTIMSLPSLLYDSRTMETVDERPVNLAQHGHG